MLIFCNGMIRAGSTLQYNMVRILVERLGIGVGEGYLEEELLANATKKLERWSLDPVWHIVKTHDTHWREAWHWDPEHIRICYIFRDIRDVAGSAKHKWGFTGEKVMEQIALAIEKYRELERTQAKSIFQRYETVVPDPATAVVELADFLGLDVDIETIRQVTYACSRKMMLKEMETARRNPRIRMLEFLKTHGVNTRIGALLNKLAVPKSIITALSVFASGQNKHSLVHPDHIQQDAQKPGNSREWLDNSELREIADRYQGWLAELGYL